MLLTYVLYLGINQRNHQVFKSSYYLSTLKFLCKERCVFCSSISTGTKNEATNSFCFLKNNERGLLLQDEEGKSERERFLALSKVTWQVVKCKRKFHTPVTACFGGGCNGGEADTVDDVSLLYCHPASLTQMTSSVQETRRVRDRRVGREGK